MFTLKVDPGVNVWVRSLPLTEIWSDVDSDVTEVSLCWGAAQARLPAAMDAVAGGELTGAPLPLEPLSPDDEVVAEVVDESLDD
jgi:hypothetical protein